MSRVVKSYALTFQPEAECEDLDCEWSTGPSPATLTRVRQHAKDTGHSVVVTSRTVSRYEVQQ